MDNLMVCIIHITLSSLYLELGMILDMVEGKERALLEDWQGNQQEA